VLLGAIAGIGVKSFFDYLWGDLPFQKQKYLMDSSTGDYVSVKDSEQSDDDSAEPDDDLYAAAVETVRHDKHGLAALRTHATPETAVRVDSVAARAGGAFVSVNLGYARHSAADVLQLAVWARVYTPVA
jgi:hypothetical protein